MVPNLTCYGENNGHTPATYDFTMVHFTLLPTKHLKLLRDKNKLNCPMTTSCNFASYVTCVCDATASFQKL